MIEIKRVSNGYIITVPADDIDEKDHVEVIEQPEGECGEAEAACNMLWAVNELIGHIGSKHDKKRVRVILEPGENYEG